MNTSHETGHVSPMRVMGDRLGPGSGHNKRFAWVLIGVLCLVPISTLAVPTPTPQQPDQNGDGQIDADDLLTLLKDWRNSEMGLMDLLPLGAAWYNSTTTPTATFSGSPSPTPTRGPSTFRNSGQELPLGRGGRALWGDFSNDGYLDFAISASTTGNPGIRFTKLLRNVSGVLTEDPNLPFVNRIGFLHAVDYDNDSDLDLFVRRDVFENDLGNFSEDLATNLPEGAIYNVGDYDNDGDSDVFLDPDEPGARSRFYRNEGGVFVEDASTTSPILHGGSTSLADIDGDVDLDLAVSYFVGDIPVLQLFENEGALFVPGQYFAPDSQVSVPSGSHVWGDYDNDGDPDLLISGTEGGGAGYGLTILLRNDDGVLGVDTQQELLPINGSPAWGDYDNDGDLDLIVSGGIVNGSIQRVVVLYANDEGRFVEDTRYPFLQIDEGKATWADYDRDGDLDLALYGRDASQEFKSLLYENLVDDAEFGNNPNAFPLPPESDFVTEYAEGTLTLAWGNGSDQETPTSGLYYNLRVGTTTGGHEIVSGAYGPPLFGNLGQNRFTVLHVPKDIYYWSVQTIDTGLAASDWSEEQIFEPEDQ